MHALNSVWGSKETNHPLWKSLMWLPRTCLSALLTCPHSLMDRIRPCEGCDSGSTKLLVKSLTKTSKIPMGASDFNKGQTKVWYGPALPATQLLDGWSFSYLFFPSRGVIPMVFKVSVIIPTLNEAKYLDTTLYHLTKQRPYEVIVADSHSKDNTR